MKMTNLCARVAGRLFGYAKRNRLMALAACAAAAVSTVGLVADEVAYDDFEDLTLVEFDVANITDVGDGTDWTNVIPGWTITNAANHVDTDADAYNGWTAMDVDSWIDEQGTQGGGTHPNGRARMRFGTDNNTALVSDPDAWDDFPPAGKASDGFNSYVSRTYDISSADLASLEISFDWDFVTEDNQIGVAEVSFDGGGSWEILTAVASANWIGDPTWGPYAFDNQLAWSTNPEGDEVQATQGTFVAGTDFTVPGGATEMTVRFGCILSGNDWWFSVDNVGIADTNGVIEFEDFEGLDLLSFPEGGVGSPPGDGTDYTQDIPSWDLLNDGTDDFPLKKMYNPSEEGAFNGWAALDAQSWTNQQGSQQRTFFLEDFFPERNTVLVADPDAHEDFRSEDNEIPEGEKEFNSFLQRRYDLSNFDNDSITIEFDWETRLESNQRGLVQISFDGGASWKTILDVDSDNIDPALDSYVYIDNNADGVASSGDVLNTFIAPDSYAAADFYDGGNVFDSNSMLLRIGCIDSSNNWWFAIDNILIEANAQAFVFGDANGDGLANFGDITGGTNAILTGTYSLEMDFNEDGVVNFGDLAGFTNAIIGN